MDRNIAVIAGAVILAVAIVAAAFMYSHKKPPAEIPDERAAQAACVAKGWSWQAGHTSDDGTWVAGVCFEPLP
ncbi:MAG: hypothetical protein ACHQY1_01510 [Myxococcota bacterium]|jgi:hypothetical protein